MKLLDFARNEYSQHGEDGMIEQVMEWLGLKTGLAVEFGAWDGYRFANTARLWTREWAAVLIESDAARFKDLETNVAPFPKVKALQAKVGIGEGQRWTDCMKGLTADVVSIDVDGNDYWIFEQSPAGPSLYIVEHNTSIPAWLDIFTPYAADNNFGCSLAALARLAKAKGYDYLGGTKSNGFFLRGDLMAKIPALERDVRDAPNKDELVYLMTSYAGDYETTAVGPYGRGKHYEKTILRGGT